MTAGNGRTVPTPGLSNKATGGVDPTAGKGDPARNYNGGIQSEPQTGAAEGPAGSTTMGPDGYGCTNSGNNAAQNMAGPGSSPTTNETVNAESTANASMQDMTGPSLGQQTQIMNTADGGRWSQSWAGNDDRNANDMSSME